MPRKNEAQGSSLPGWGSFAPLSCEVSLSNGQLAGLSRFNATQLLLASLATCLQRTLETAAGALRFQQKGIAVDMSALRQEAPSKILSIYYDIVLDTQESRERMQMLHRAVRRDCEMFNIIAESVRISGEIRAHH